MPDVVRNKEDLLRCNGNNAVLYGRYQAVERPVKGVHAEGLHDHAVVLLEDGLRVYLEPFESPAAHRAAPELQTLDGKTVGVWGIVYKFMPARGESPLAPCIAQITKIVEEQ